MTNSDSTTETNNPTIGTSRRSVLAAMGLVASGIGVQSVTSKDEGSASATVEIPPRLTQYPEPVSSTTLDYRQYVPAGAPIHHTASWITVGEETPADLQAFFDAADHTFRIDGQQIAPSEGSWTWEWLTPLSDDTIQTQQWKREWIYTTEPKAPGRYSYEAVLQFTEPHTSLVSDGTRRTWEGTHRYHGEYLVVDVPLSGSYLESHFDSVQLAPDITGGEDIGTEAENILTGTEQ